MIRRFIVLLSERLIKKAQKQIGLISFKITQDKSGMVSMGELMKQPFRFEFYFVDKYKFNVNKAHRSHIVISANEYKLIDYSYDPRDGTQTRSFLTPADLSRYCAMAQITVAVDLSLSRDEEYRSLDPKKSYEQLIRQALLAQEHRKMLTERLELYLMSGEARFVSWLIKILSKFSLTTDSNQTPR